MAKLKLTNKQTPKVGALILTCLLLSACASKPMPIKTSDFSPVLPPVPIEKTVADGSVYSGGINDGLFGDRKAYRVGDIITIILREKTMSEKSASNVTSRTANNNVIPTILKGDATLSTAMAASTIDNTGKGSTSQSNTLGGDISATVVRALTNGNLIIRGEKMITLNDGNEYIQISGMIRSEDVQPDNTVLSKRIANAEISYSGDGDYVDATKAGWGTKLFYKIWPF
ncbi:flagellar basal body L-ring protein FlgH [Candidatus Njordibacter sp. Uisw_039]|uniref:flagellar basal body L-ring protein FlgH n=1 Tax=Candidatus Njordibacter sp. Uisw_039 TaxID=3230972 RepID=UPI003D3DE680